MKQEILKRLQNTYCRISRSKIEGVGVVAIREIPQNTNIFFGVPIQADRRFKLSELKKLPKGALKMIDDFLCVEKDGTVIIPEYGLNGLDISYFLNCSKKPNVKTIDGGANFVTLKKIKPGEELTAAYNTYENIASSQWQKII
ncbi:MAG: SET domain-containing protein [Candidatus Komeilibacteria bacterium]|nr:SET domain-containing protein [Candidatus Komeilibacteria bacterium]